MAVAGVRGGEVHGVETRSFPRRFGPEKSNERQLIGVFVCVHVCRDAPQFNGSSNPSPTMTSLADGCCGKRVQPANSYKATASCGLYGYERSAQSPVNNFCRFPPSLVDARDDDDEPQDPTLDQQVRIYIRYARVTRTPDR